jgi:hypothetical protein
LAAARLENIARFLDFVGESITRAAEQAREILDTKNRSNRSRQDQALAAGRWCGLR